MKKFALHQIIRAKTDALFAKEMVVELLRRKIVDLNNAIENRNYCCSECNFTCPDQDTMKSHSEKAHPPVTRNTVYCASCGAEFVEGATQQEQLLAHIKTCDKHPLGIEIRELRRQVLLLKEGSGWSCAYCHKPYAKEIEAEEHERTCENNPSLARIKELEAQVDILKEGGVWMCSYCLKVYEKEADLSGHVRTCPENPFVKELAGVQALLDVAQTELAGWQKKDQIDREWEDKLRAILEIPNKRVSILKAVEKLVYIVDLAKRTDKAKYDDSISYRDYKGLEIELHEVFT